MITRNPSLSADRPFQVLREREPDGQGGIVDVLTVFLTTSECPVGCAMCDLWQNTLTTATPSGAIVRQLESVISDVAASGWIKLYNSGNFFDPQSIPPSDYAAISDRLSGFSRVIVENHPKFGHKRLIQFRDLIDASLEIAVGLETVQPRWLDRLDKRMSRDDFDRYAAQLHRLDVDLRAFLIIGVPGIDAIEAVRWTRLSIRHAVAVGARHVSLIPARTGHGWNGRGDELPVFSVVQLHELLSMVIGEVGDRACVTMDVWGLESDCPVVREINRMNQMQRATAR